jgi:hypothetical protein
LSGIWYHGIYTYIIRYNMCIYIYEYIYISRTGYDLNGVSENGGHRPFFYGGFFWRKRCWPSERAHVDLQKSEFQEFGGDDGYPLVNVYNITVERSTHFLGKSTISTGPWSIVFCLFTRPGRFSRISRTD